MIFSKRFFVLGFLFLFMLTSCKKNQKAKNENNDEVFIQSKVYIFLDFYEDMTYDELNDVLELLIKEEKIAFVPSPNAEKYFYLTGFCKVPMSFEFGNGGLKSIVLEDARCLIEDFSQKYKEVEFINQEVDLVNYTAYNDDFNPNSVYQGKEHKVFCYGDSRENWKSEFDFKVRKEYQVVKSILKKEPTIIKKGAILIEIKSKEAQSGLIKDKVYSNSIDDISCRCDLDKSEFLSDAFSEESCEQFYMRTRSKYVAYMRRDFNHNYDIRYQSIQNHENILNQRENHQKNLEENYQKQKERINIRAKSAMDEI
ncbi:hypothetical protein [Nonlabens agnitus]|uniref:Lipoprotein n=1 Tax=Nonlabens agnitus TaxID=870484 RepID=A0A2S9WXI2_9FLAO|nr:hypothetical protein [Nonlabens agnitus]PRP68174.1 hypothetical protein BST86_14275 [Nonlabens agnitus]